MNDVPTDQAAPAEVQPETAPVETAAEQTAPVETQAAPVETQPESAAPVETVADEVAAVVSEPVVDAGTAEAAAPDAAPEAPEGQEMASEDTVSEYVFEGVAHLPPALRPTPAGPGSNHLRDRQ